MAAEVDVRRLELEAAPGDQPEPPYVDMEI